MGELQKGVGIYQLACEASPHKLQIDAWLNENVACTEISRRLMAQFGEKISDRSVLKYKKYRENRVKESLKEDPSFRLKMDVVQDKLNTEVAKIKEVDLLGKLGSVIEDSAEMLADAKSRNVQIRTAQDFRHVSQTMLDAIKIYGDTMLKAQKMQKIEDDPSLLRATSININVKSALVDMLSGAINQGDYSVIDKLRAGMGMQSDIIDADVVDMDSDEISAEDGEDNE